MGGAGRGLGQRHLDGLAPRLGSEGKWAVQCDHFLSSLWYHCVYGVGAVVTCLLYCRASPLWKRVSPGTVLTRCRGGIIASLDLVLLQSVPQPHTVNQVMRASSCFVKGVICAMSGGQVTQ